ncbi:FRG domain-containing protein [Sulfurisoma sediminicola]|uniref:FRG domain-containing protein n=2 Tax=Sulfurisoma sediminicola TaxID=1381557 RepID=A0A497XA62_9PROT|nr:FRG domain-containing protein [Sulfurisoma sediminicola]RLJ62727.1 FRG domain-containing protein [Sulfurisoma sediminicola]
MLRISSSIWSHHSITTGKKYPLKDVLSSMPVEIATFRELVRAVAEISYHNPEQVLFYRGQANQYWKNTEDGQRINSFYPSIYRLPGRSLTENALEERYRTLQQQSDALLKRLKEEGIRGHDKLAKFSELTWAILQHYEVCPTPFLDVTHSLRVAASFALNDAEDAGYLYIFGFPHPNGSITYSVEHEIINIRLLSICPPEAQRPYFQEGFLVGTFPSKRLRKHPSLDTGVRLIAKFKLVAKAFWDENFHAIPTEALYPGDDRIKEICSQLKTTSENDPTIALTRTRRKRRAG